MSRAARHLARRRPLRRLHPEAELDAVGEKVRVEEDDGPLVRRIVRIIKCHESEARWLVRTYRMVKDMIPFSGHVRRIALARTIFFRVFEDGFGPARIDGDRVIRFSRRGPVEFGLDDQLALMVELSARVEKAATRYLRRPARQHVLRVAPNLHLDESGCRALLDRYREETRGRGHRDGFVGWYALLTVFSEASAAE